MIVLVFVIYSIIDWFISFLKTNWRPEIVSSNTRAPTAIRPRPRRVKEISCLIVYFVTGEEKSISGNVRFVTRAEGEKVRFSSLCYKKMLFGFLVHSKHVFPKKSEK